MGAVSPTEPYRRRGRGGHPRRTGARSAALAALLALAALPAFGAGSAQPAKGDAAAAPAQTASAPASAPIGNAVKPAPPQSWAEQQSALCAAAVHDAEGKYSVPGGLLGTIAKVESGRPITAMADVRAWPWTIDADGHGYFFESKAAAVAWAKLGLARGVAFMDIGCMQVDLQMHPGAFRSIEEAFDPAANVDYGARYLQRLHDADANGNWYGRSGSIIRTRPISPPPIAAVWLRSVPAS